VITDGEQRKYQNFWTYSVHALPNTSADGFKIPFAAGHVRRMPRLIGGPFQYRRYADSYLLAARRYTQLPLKQAVISASALSLMYPAEGIPDYPRDQFPGGPVARARDRHRGCLSAGAHRVQIDFTEGRLAMKMDRSGNLLHSFIELNNLVLSRFTAEERDRLGVHTCPGGDRDSTHSADIDYADLLPSLFQLDVNNFYIALAAKGSPHARSPRSRNTSSPNIGSSWGSSRRSIRGSRLPRRCGTAPSWQLGSFRRISSVRRTIVDSLRSATTTRPVGTRPLRRFARASWQSSGRRGSGLR